MMRNPIRKATRNDLAACARIIRNWMDRTEWMSDDLSSQQLEDQIREAFPKRDIWVSGEPIDGYMSIDPAESKVGALYCSRTGEGVGKRLLDKAKVGRDYLWLTTHMPNVEAQRFYKREGFVEAGVEPLMPPEIIPILRMEWRA